MIVTDKFVYVHQPKTGGSFVTTALFRLHGVSWNLLVHARSAIRKDLAFRRKYGTFIIHNNKHGGCNEIPARHARDRILATVRNPYDLLVSQYEFGWWKRREFLEYYRAVPGFARDYPRFPDLAFAEFVELTDRAFRPRAGGESGPGLMTREFVEFYFKAPREILGRLDDQYVAARGFAADMHPVHFLRQESLNRDLHAFLAGIGYDPADLGFIHGMGRVLPGGKGRGPDQRWERYYTPELKQRVRQREGLLFAIFPEFDAPAITEPAGRAPCIATGPETRGG